MPQPIKILIVDDVADSRALVVRTILRKFPTALVQECQESATAVLAASTERFDVIVAHRAVDIDGLQLVRIIRAVNAAVPVLMISGLDRTRATVEAGATRFHNYDEWLRIGTVIAEMLAVPATVESPAPFATVKEPRDAARAAVAGQPLNPVAQS